MASFTPFIKNAYFSDYVYNCLLLTLPELQWLCSINTSRQFLAANRKSYNPPAGTIEVKPYNVTANTFYGTMGLEDGVSKAVYNTFISRLSLRSRIKLQIDSAPPHTGHRNKERIQEYCD